MKREINIHGFDVRLARAERLVDSRNPLSAKNVELISGFKEHCFSSDLSEARVVKYVLSLRKLAEWLKVDFDEAATGDIERVVNHDQYL